MTTVLVSLLLCSLWVAAWLNWLFNGEVRNVLVVCFPSRMLADTPRSEILLKSPSDLTVFICGVSDIPMFFRKLLSCPRCLSAYVSAAGTLVAVFAGLPALPAILVWAASAWIGLKLHTHIK